MSPSLDVQGDEAAPADVNLTEDEGSLLQSAAAAVDPVFEEIVLWDGIEDARSSGESRMPLRKLSELSRPAMGCSHYS